MVALREKDIYDVHCRIGSLEMAPDGVEEEADVHCRIGSLETKGLLQKLSLSVHCRIGSLEKHAQEVVLAVLCSLPHRQFRNGSGAEWERRTPFTAA